MNVIYYMFDENTGEYTGYRLAQEDPVTSKMEGRIVYLGCAKSETEIEPLPEREGFARCFIDGTWRYIEDHRGVAMYSTVDAHESSMIALGKIPDGYTLLIPCELPKWDGEKWIVDATKKKAADNEIVKAKLTDIDLKSIRSIREWLAAQPTAPQFIKDYETQAATERGKLK